MKFRGLIAAAVVLFGLAGVLYWSERHEAKKALEAPTISPPAILRVDPATVSALTVKQKTAQPIAMARSGAQWQITSPGTFPADPGTVSGMLTTLAPLNSQSVVEDHATNLANFGLNDPSVEVDVTGKDNKTSRLLIGDDAPTGDGVYVAVAGDLRVFIASSFIKTSLNKSLSDLRDKRLLPIDASTVSGLELIRKGGDITFARIQNGWQIEKPQPYRTDDFQVDDLLQQLTSAKWDGSVSPEDAAKTFAHAAPVATVKLTGGVGNDTLDVRKDKEDYYAKSSAVAGAWKVDSANSSALGQALGHSLDEFRNKQLFAFGYSDPDKIEYHSGATNLVLTHANNAWWSNGQKMDPMSVESLVTALRDEAASKFVDSGFTTPQIEIIVTANGGRKVEKVQIQKTGDSAIARLEGDSSFYALDAPTINSLTSAIAGIQPAAGGKK
jgi:Domain of unknown function (DUF4340)